VATVLGPAQIGLPVWALAIVGAFKIASLLVGFGLAFMGYRLFLAGIGGTAGEFEASSDVRKLRLTQAAPGTFFALFGAAVIAATIYKGFDVELPGVVSTALRTIELPPVPETGNAPD
jgi:hypothetical protein